MLLYWGLITECDRWTCAKSNINNVSAKTNWILPPGLAGPGNIFGPSFVGRDVYLIMPQSASLWRHSALSQSRSLTGPIDKCVDKQSQLLSGLIIVVSESFNSSHIAFDDYNHSCFCAAADNSLPVHTHNHAFTSAPQVQCVHSPIALSHFIFHSFDRDTSNFFVSRRPFNSFCINASPGYYQTAMGAVKSH